MAAVFEEVRSVKGDYSCLVGLGDISKDCIDHWYQHTVLVRVPRILNDGNDVCSLLSNV